MSSLNDWIAATKNTSALKPDDLIGVLANVNLKQPTHLSPSKPAPPSPGETGGKDDEDKPLSKAENSLLQKIVRKGLIESKQELEIQRKDPTSPLYSVKTFEALHLKPELLKGK